MPPETNVRQDEPPARVVPLFPCAPTGAWTTCSECGGPIKTKRAASYCRPRCRAGASRRRRVEAALKKLDAAEKGLQDALEVVRDLRGVLVFGGTP